jgi:hypothetical protein
VKPRRVQWVGQMKNKYRILVGRRTRLGKRSYGILRSKWEDNINMDHEDTYCKDENWMEIAQDHFQHASLFYMRCWVFMF